MKVKIWSGYDVDAGSITAWKLIEMPDSIMPLIGGSVDIRIGGKVFSLDDGIAPEFDVDEQILICWMKDISPLAFGDRPFGEIKEWFESQFWVIEELKFNKYGNVR